MNKHLPLIALFLAVGSSNPIAIKFALNADWPPFLLGICRMIFIALVYGAIIWAMKEDPWGKGKARSYSIMAALSKGSGVIFLYLSLFYIPANRAIILSTLSPLMNLVIVHLLLQQEQVRKNHVLGVLVSLVGILLLLASREEGVSLEGGFYLGDIFAISTVLFNQLMTVFEKKAISHGATPRQLLNSTNIITILVFVGAFLISSEKIGDIPMTPAGGLSYLYLITVVGIFLFYYRRWLITKVELVYLNSFSHLGKAISLLYAYLVLGEHLSLASIAAFGVIISGTVIAARKA